MELIEREKQIMSQNRRRGLLLILCFGVIATSSWSEDSKEDRLGALELEVQSLQRQMEDMRRRSSLLSMTEEVKQFKEYVCAKGHLYDTPPAKDRCPIDGTLVSERVTYRKVKLARQESIAEKIAAALEEGAKKKVEVGASTTGILQQVGRSGVAESTQRLFTQASLNLFFVSRPAASSILFIDLEGVGGQGPDQMLKSLSGVNNNAGRFSPPSDKVMVREAWLRSDFWGKRAHFVAGKVDLTNYFDANRVANDETTQFLAAVFVHNPVLENPVNGPGASFVIDATPSLYAGIGAQSETGTSDVRYKDVYSILETGARLRWLFGREGTYRLWIRRHGQAAGFERAAGVSFDQRLSPHWMAFARLGCTDRGIPDKASAWSGGLAFLGPFQRVNDQIGAGFSRYEKSTVGRENAAELFYRFFLTDHLAVTPIVQGIFNSVKQQGQALANPSWISGIRTQVNF